MAKDYLIVDHRPELDTRRGGPVPSAMSLDLEKGLTVFTTSRMPPSFSTHSYLRQRGYRVHAVKGEHAGKVGYFLWAEK